MEVESSGERSDGAGDEERTPSRGSAGPLGWLYHANHSPGVVEFLRRARRALPGDPDFGDPLSADGVGGPRAAARVADRLLDREAVSREISLGALQVWQALTERVAGRPANPEVTLVFSDLVGFSSWSLSAGDDATLRLLRRVAQVFEPPLLEAGGRIVKRMGDGSMAVFTDAATAVRAVLAAMSAVRTVEVDGYTPRMRVGVHTGRPQRIGSDWLGVDVNIAARVMERATRGGLVVSQTTLDSIPADEFEALDVTVKRQRRQVFSIKPDGVPPDLAMYRMRRAKPTVDESQDDDS
ncbi:adenylate and guanylate cyclase catalytic domain-containing protein [Mycolicibacterium litorale]|uniref:Adenylate and guanylate cyclase catalytic domain-containing protein n=1 Tax=Mycolicibacterium litorale TaxID=758802 RepID=A0A6S6PA99_9MYCO|nr:adenylate/guanylate cyclase domain-containing protein [Mycolicibacterium litorale]BCI53610.1 adenylate and guanylate cyclase catalytic domain-containing protein [Mycolicibacterium litorale]